MCVLVARERVGAPIAFQSAEWARMPNGWELRRHGKKGSLGVQVRNASVANIALIYQWLREYANVPPPIANL